MQNRLRLIQCRSSEIMTHGGTKKVRNFLLVVNHVAIDMYNERMASANYYEGDSLDRYINLQIEVYEAALGCKVEREFLDYPVTDARNEFFSAFRKCKDTSTV